MKKRFLSTLLAIVMLLSLLPTTVFAEGNSTQTADSVAAVSSEGTTLYYGNLPDAISGAADGATVTLLKDVEVSQVIEITKNLTLDGGESKHTIDSSANRIIWVDASGVTVNLKNLKLTSTGKTAERAVQVNTGFKNVTLNIDNCEMSATYYAINLTSGTTVTMDVKNSTITGWGAFNGWSDGYQISFENCTLNGINDKGYDADGWNNFGTIVLEGDTTGATEMHASGNHVSFKDCTIKASQTTGNIQHALLFNSKSNNNIVTMDGCTIELGAGCDLLVDNGGFRAPKNQFIVDSGTYNGLDLEGTSYSVTLNGDGTYTIASEGNVWYYWEEEEGYAGVKKNLEEVLTAGWLMNGEYIDLFNDVKLSEDVTVVMASEDDTVFNLALSNYTVTGGKICFPAGISVVCDKAADTVFTVADGCVLSKTVNADGSVTYSSMASADAVALVGSAYYDTLSEAIAAAKTGDTVTLIKDIELSSYLNITESINLDLNGKTITSAGLAFNVNTENVQFVIKDSGTTGKIISNNTGNLIAVSNGKLIVEGGELVNNWYVIYVYQNGVATIKGGTLKSSVASAVSTNGSAIGSENYSANAKINIEGGKLISTSDVTIYLPAGTLNISGGEIEGATAVYSKCGTTNITGGTITGTGNDVDFTHYGGGCAATGDALVIEACNYPNGNPTVNISGGAFSSAKADAIGYYQYNDNRAESISVTGGYFTSDPTAYCAEGYRAGASDKAGYEYKVVEKKADENEVTEVIPSTGDTTANVKAGVEETAEITAVANAVANTTATGLAGVAMDEAAATEITDTEKNTAKGNLIEKVGDVADDAISYHNQVYLDVTVNGVTTEGDKKKIDLDITAMSQLIASTEANPDNINLSDVSEGGNAVVVASKPITITTPVTISIPLPATFANVGDTVYIQHKSYEYEAAVTEGPAESGTVIATFTNPHGFSEFVITTSSVAVAKIDDVSYLSLQAAVDAVTNGQTINVLTAGQTATVSRTVKFTVTGAACTINLGTNYTDRDESASVFDIVYTESTTPSTGGGGGGGSTTYSVSAPTSTKNGSVTVSPKSASKGKTVTITVKPDAGYELDKLTVTDKNGDTVTLTKKSDTQYTFTMPASKVEITAVFAEIPQTDPCDDFDDLDPNAWYHDAVNYVLTKGMMSGVSDDEFAPNATLTRAMVVQILWAVEGKPQVNYAMNYGDVSQSDWYAEAVRWAASQGIASGVADGSFAPGASITREQLMTMLYAYAQKKGEGFTGSWMFQLDFADQSQVSSWAYEPACWCTMNGVVSGKDGGRLDPVGTATRAEAAQMLMKFCQTLGE